MNAATTSPTSCSNYDTTIHLTKNHLLTIRLRYVLASAILFCTNADLRVFGALFHHPLDLRDQRVEPVNLCLHRVQQA